MTLHVNPEMQLARSGAGFRAFPQDSMRLEISCALQFQQIDTVHMHHPGEECGMEREMGRERES